MLQIVSDVAPGAKLAFHTAAGGEVAFAIGIINLAKPVANGGAGASVIVDDIVYSSEPYFQDGIVTQVVDIVAANGVAYFSSAGNYARGSYESAFVPGGIDNTVGGQSYTFHDFDPSEVVNNFQAITINGAFKPGLQWDQPFFSYSTTRVGSQNDLDLFLFVSPSFTSILISSSTNNNLNADPFESSLVASGTGRYVTRPLRRSLAPMSVVTGKYDTRPLRILSARTGLWIYSAVNFITDLLLTTLAGASECLNGRVSYLLARLLWTKDSPGP
jgi:hypothetical protein